jgi:hypothetical protein
MLLPLPLHLLALQLAAAEDGADPSPSAHGRSEGGVFPIKARGP